MSEAEERQKVGLENLDDSTLAAIVKEATQEGNFQDDPDAQAAFRELQRRGIE